MITKDKVDKKKSKSLKEIAEMTLRRLEQTDLEEYPSNTLTDYYDIIRKLMGSLIALEGVKVSGEGSHVEIINHVCRKYSFNTGDRLFLQELRDQRNKVYYQGLNIAREYIVNNKSKIERIIKILLKKIKLSQ